MMRWFVALGLVLFSAAPAFAQQLFDLEWSATTRVERWVGGGLVPQVVVREGERRGRGLLTVRSSSELDAVLVFHLGGDAGGGGRVLPGGQGRLDETTAFPRALTTDQGPLPAAGPRGVGGTFRVVGNPASPARVEIVHVEAFVCRATPRVCGNVKRWEHVFIGTGRPVSGAPASPPAGAP